MNNYYENKKVILRESKRHTARRVASTRYAALSNPDLVGGYPIQTWLGVPPSRPGQGGTPSRPGQGVPPTGMGYPPPEMGYPPNWDGVPLRPGMGYSSRPGTEYPPQTWDRVPRPRPGMGYPPLDLRWGTPLPRPEMGYPPAPPQVWTDWKDNLPSSFGCGR